LYNFEPRATAVREHRRRENVRLSAARGRGLGRYFAGRWLAASKSEFSVMHWRRGGEVRKRGIRRRGVTPGDDQYPNLAAGFRRRALFFEEPPDAKSERLVIPPVVSHRTLGSG